MLRRVGLGAVHSPHTGASLLCGSICAYQGEMVPRISAITAHADFTVTRDEPQPAAGVRLGEQHPFEPFQRGPDLVHARNMTRETVAHQPGRDR